MMTSCTVDRYLAACLEEGFGPDTPLYVASGIFSAMTPLVEDNLATVRRELASHVFHKGQVSDLLWFTYGPITGVGVV